MSVYFSMYLHKVHRHRLFIRSASRRPGNRSWHTVSVPVRLLSVRCADLIKSGLLYRDNLCNPHESAFVTCENIILLKQLCCKFTSISRILQDHKSFYLSVPSAAFDTVVDYSILIKCLILVGYSRLVHVLVIIWLFFMSLVKIISWWFYTTLSVLLSFGVTHAQNDNCPHSPTEPSTTDLSLTFPRLDLCLLHYNNNLPKFVLTPHSTLSTLLPTLTGVPKCWIWCC